jgi:hypothetical protein
MARDVSLHRLPDAAQQTERHRNFGSLIADPAAFQRAL